MLSCYVYSNASDADLELTGAHAWELYAACLADINAGRLGAEDVSGVGTKDDADYTPLYLMFIVTTNTPGETVNLYVDSIPLGADETVRVLEQAGGLSVEYDALFPAVFLSRILPDPGDKIQIDDLQFARLLLYDHTAVINFFYQSLYAAVI